jgi:hypothetical protein
MNKQTSGFYHNAKMTSVWKIVTIIMGIILLYTYFGFILFGEGGQYTFDWRGTKKEDFVKPPNFYTPHLVIASILFSSALTSFIVVKANKTKVTLRKEKDGTYLDITGFVFNAREMRIHKCIAYIIIRSFPFSPKIMLVMEFLTGKGNYMICEAIKDYEKYNLPLMDNNILKKQLLSTKQDTVLSMAKFLGLIDK